MFLKTRQPTGQPRYQNRVSPSFQNLPKLLLTRSFRRCTCFSASQCQTPSQLRRSSIWDRPFSLKHGHGILPPRPSFTRLYSSANASIPSSPRARHDVSNAHGSVWTQPRRHVRHALPSLSAICDPSVSGPSTWDSLPATWNPDADHAEHAKHTKLQSRANISIWLLPSFAIRCPLWSNSYRPNPPGCISSPY